MKSLALKVVDRVRRNNDKRRTENQERSMSRHQMSIGRKHRRKEMDETKQNLKKK
jgi:hypothetical protein